MYRPVLIGAPAATPVSVNEAKAQFRVEHGDDDALIAALIDSAVQYLDGWTGVLGRCLVTQSWRQDFECLGRILRLPLFPVSAVTSVKYDNPSKVEQTVDPANYDLLTDDLGSYVRFKFAFVLPQVDAYNPPSARIEYVAGYADAAAVPAPIRQAVLLLIQHWYDNRTAVLADASGRATTAVLPFAVDALLAPYRRTRF